jgi:undecaprenyl-diphosphatase
VSFVEPVILGVVQGATEFLPISSSAHLRIAGEFLPSARDPGATFTAITQIGTEVAVLAYFRRDIARIIRRWAHSMCGKVSADDPDARMGWQIIIEQYRSAWRAISRDTIFAQDFAPSP